MLKKNSVIVFSGLDGAGKSTQIDLLIHYLHDNGIKTKYIWTRGGYTSGIEFIKQTARKLLGKKLPPPGRNTQREKTLKKTGVRKVWLYLAILDLIRIYGFQIRLLKLANTTVVNDRYIEDTLIDFTLNFPGENVREYLLWKILEKVAVRPDFSFMLLIPVEESLRRSELKDEPFPDSPEVLESRLKAYKKLVQQEVYHEVDCLQHVDEVFAKIRNIILGKV